MHINTFPLDTTVLPAIQSQARLPLDRQGLETLAALHKVKRYGTIIPWHWERVLRDRFGRAGEVAAKILALVCEWWTPAIEIRDGREFLRRRFRQDLPHLSYKYFADKTGLKPACLKRALQVLERACDDGSPLVKREFRDAIKDGQIVNNQMFLRLYPEAVEKTLGWSDPSFDAHDLTEFDIALDEAGNVATVEPTTIFDEVTEPIAPEPVPQPVTAVQPTALTGSNRPLSDSEMDAIAQSQDAVRAGELGHAYDYRTRNMWPQWRTGWGRKQVSPEFVAFLSREFAKQDWGAKTTPQQWLSGRERDNWSAILVQWDAFLEDQQRRQQVTAQVEASLGAQSLEPEVEPSQDDRLVFCLRRAVSSFSLPSLPPRAVDRLNEAIALAAEAGLHTEIDEILAANPKAAIHAKQVA